MKPTVQPGPGIAGDAWLTAPEVAAAFDQARHLCEQVGDTTQRFRILRLLASIYGNQAAMQAFREVTNQCMDIAQRHPDLEFTLEGHRVMGVLLLWQGEFTQARVHFEHIMTLYDRTQHGSHALLYGQDVAVASLASQSLLLWMLGYPDQAQTAIRDAVSLAWELAHAYSLAYARALATFIRHFLGETETLHDEAETLITYSIEHGFPAYVAWGMIMKGWTQGERGEREAGMAQIREGETARQAVGLEFARPMSHVLLSDTYMTCGQVEDGLAVLSEVLTFVATTRFRWFEAGLHRLKGKWLLNAKCGAHNVEFTAESCFHQALDVSRQQQAKSWDLRAATSLARLRQSQGKRQDAYDLLAPVYGWFTEGFDTADVQNAKALLDDLESGGR
jgi:predicted ATPase